MKKSLLPILSLAFCPVVFATDYTITSTDSAVPQEISSVTSAATFVNGSGTSADVYAHITGATTMINKGPVVVDENVHLTIDGNLAINAGTSYINIAKGSSVVVGVGTTRGGFVIMANTKAQSTSTICGSLEINRNMTAGSSSFHADKYIFSVGDARGKNAQKEAFRSPTLVLGEGASIKANGVYGAYNTFTKALNRVSGASGGLYAATLQVGDAEKGKVAEDALVFDDFLYFVNKTVLTLNSSNAIISGAKVESNTTNKDAGFKNAISQKDSTIFVVGVNAQTDTTVTAGDFTLNSSVANELGTINATSGSTITLVSDLLNVGEAFVLHNLEITADAEGNKSLFLKLNFNEDSSQNMQIENFYELYNADDVILNVEIYDHVKSEYVAGNLNENYMVSQDGWITAVPEPAEWAMIFGAIALGFVAYRRRK